jgi:hypothetical protein
MFDTVYDGVFPAVENKYSDKVQFIFRQQIQPWHPSSTLVHEAGAAVLQTQPEKFWEFSKALFDKQTEYFDANVVYEPRNKTYERLAKLAGSVGIDDKKIYGLLEISDKPDSEGGTNSGNKVTNDIKLMTKASFHSISRSRTLIDSCKGYPSSRRARHAHRSVQCKSFN